MRGAPGKWNKMACRNFAALLALFFPAITRTQTVVGTVAVGKHPQAIAVNQTTNKIYVANCPTTANSEPGVNGTVTVIDGETNATTTVPAGICPVAIAMNPASNKIYVANLGKFCIISNSCNNAGSVTVIDGTTDSAFELQLPQPNLPHPRGIAVDSTTNKVYVANHFSSEVAVIDGSTNAITMVSTASLPYDVATNAVTNKIYVSSFDVIVSGTETAITEIDGVTNATHAVTDPKAANPVAIAVNPTTNKIYVVNLGDTDSSTDPGSITVIDGAADTTANIVDPRGFRPHALAINPVTNKVYVANGNNLALSGNGGVIELDGATNSLTTVSDSNAQTVCHEFSNRTIAVDPTSNQIYVANCGSNNVTVIDGVTNTTITVTDSSAIDPIAIAVNSVSNKIYVANAGSDNVSVIHGTGVTSTFTLSVSTAGSGSGSITSKDGTILCFDAGGTCSAKYPTGTSVVLSATPDGSSTFTAWNGACTGTAPDSCTVTINSDQTVTATFDIPDFAVRAAATSLTLKRGGQASEMLSFSAQGGFSGTIALMCSVSGSSPVPACGISPASVTPGINATLTVNSAASAAALAPRVFERAATLLAAVLPLVLMSCVLTTCPGKKRHRVWALCLLIPVATILPAACGGSSSSQPPHGQTYTVTVTATSGAIQHSTTVLVTIN